MTSTTRPRLTFERWLAITFVCGVLPAVVLAQAPEKTQPVRVAIASHEIARGVVLSYTDFGYVPTSTTTGRTTPTSGVPAGLEPATERDSLVGWMTRRLITAGEALRAPAVVPPQLVKSGDVVDIVFESAGVSVTMRGKATRSAAIGERVTVRMDNQRRLEGMVVGPGRVRVN